ncbi:hypothetical protein [Chitinimonas lacunae]|uniref:Uncharacterized protein n=1 Tax=Chitinimonas lacunae TaxID=1963018 RepID=A0ABV8MSL5_9NEIS
MAVLKPEINSWWFEVDESIPSLSEGNPAQVLEGFLICLWNCLSIFREGRRVFSSELIFSRRWIKVFGEDSKGFDKERVCVELSGLFPAEIKARIMDILISNQETSGYVIPGSIEVRGLFKPLGTDVLPAEIVLEFCYVGIRVIKIRAHGEEWLPFSLDGKKVNQFHKLYAEFLSDCLEEVEQELGVKPIYDDYTDFCQVVHYRLENLRDGCGDLLGVDEKGRALPASE